MPARDHFPLGIATDAAFCNRTKETHLLVQNIQHGKHTLLMATRRYGKSSLALRAIKQSGLPYSEIDFYMAKSEKAIESYILNGVTHALGKTLGPLEKVLTTIKKHVKTLKPKLTIGNTTFQLELTADIASDPASNVKEGLLLLERLLEEKGKQVVLLLDEFQNVGVIAQGKGIEGAIRHVAQKTKYLSFIFSGSNRKLLKTMFEDDTRPLYKLCWKLSLGRITFEDYQKHIQKIARTTWKQALDETALATITTLTERHPFYLNKLCDRLWLYHTEKPPSAKEVTDTWQAILEEEKSDVVKEISLLSLGQKSVLLHIAEGSTTQLTSKKTMLELQMSSSSIITALEGLEEKDVIEKIDDAYHIINPVLKFYALKGSKGVEF